MNKQDFLSKYLVNRRETDCEKWDELEQRFGGSDMLPLWIADMEFHTCDAITDALNKRNSHGVFGYSFAGDGYYAAYDSWMRTRHNCPTDREEIRFTSGCVTSMAYVLGAFTQPGDAVMILTPIYFPFHNVVTYNGRTLVTVDLNYDGKGHFTMDYDAIDRAIAANDVKLFLMCSPHNPVGRVWTEEELDAVLSICQKHGVLVCADEIHQDFTFGGHTFIPAATVAGGKYKGSLITLNSTSKTFNLAGLLHSQMIIYDEKLRETYDLYARGMNRTSLSTPGLIAAQAGYEAGAEWFDALRGVIWDNYCYLKSELNRRLPKAIVCDMEGTYLPMLDLRNCLNPDDIVQIVQKKCRLAVNYGENFGKNFKPFIRLNLATDPQIVAEAAERLAQNL